jgi:hypothetical protein
MKMEKASDIIINRNTIEAMLKDNRSNAKRFN